VPFSRFYKLPPEKREGLLEVAAQEFVQHGFEDASINRILERVQLVDQELDIAALTAENFWQTFAELHRLPLLRSYEQPWLFASLRVAGRLSPATLEREPLATLAKQLRTWVMAIVKRGQEVGVIRSDIPDELIFAWLQALDDASDQWLLVQWKDLDRAAISRISDQTVDAMRRAMVP
jgi:AcrR family transcriptional regulator